MKTLTKPVPLVFFITLFGGILRFLFLDRIPNAIGGDELNYILTAKAIWLSGSDITGNWNPISILWFQYPPGPSQAELLYILQAPIVGPLPFSLLTARILPALLSTLSIPLLFLIAKKLFNSQVGVISAFFLAINPWSIYIGRTAYENPFAVFFFLAAFVVLFYFKSWKLYFSIPLLFAAFYSYIGTKLIFIPFVFGILWYAYAHIQKRKHKKTFLIISGSCLLLVLFFTYFLFSGNGNQRAGDILLPTSSELASQVDTIRRTSIENPITQFFENKPVLFIRILAEKFYKTFSLDYLFFQGDMFFTVGRHGLFYAIDAVFFISGIWFLLKKQKREAIFLGILIVISTFPQLFHTAKIDNFSFHLILMYPLLLMVMAYGAWIMLAKFKSKFTYIIFFLVYVLFLLNFFQIYFFQTPLQGYFDFKLRTLAKYVTLAANNSPVIIYTPNKTNILQKYMFYANTLDQDTNITIRECPEEKDTLPKNATSIVDSYCEFKFKDPSISLAQLKDSGETYKIYQDKICKNVPIRSYISHLKFSDFLIEQMSPVTFCQAFVVRQ